MNKYFDANISLSMFSKNYMSLKRNLPIRPSEMAVLNIITQTSGEYTPVIIAKMLNVSKPMITAHISVLVKKGYVDKCSCGQDHRAYYLFPTKKAIDLVEKEKLIMIDQLKKLENKMGQQQFETLVAMTQKANEIITSGEIV